MRSANHELDSPTQEQVEDKRVRTDRRKAVQQGTDAWQRLKSSRDIKDWWAVAEALKVLQDEAASQAGARTGALYATKMESLLQLYRLHDIDKGDRSRAIEMLNHRAAIEKWLSTLPRNQQLRINHPSTVLRHWEKATNPAAQVERKKRSATLKETEQQLAEALEYIDRLESSWDEDTEAEDLMAVLTAIFSERTYDDKVVMLKTLAHMLGVEVEAKETTDRRAKQSVPPLLLEHHS
jgi:glutaredoxin 2